MKKIIFQAEGASASCPICGNSPLTGDEVVPCDHLLFIESNAGDEPWFISNEFDLSAVEETDDPPTHLELLEEQYPGDNAVLFVLGSPFPLDLSVYVAYKTRT
jgi:hypothetical protein